MKTTRVRSMIVFLLAASFVFGLGVFFFRLIFHGEAWATSSVNQHLSGSGSLSTAGQVLDRNNVVLAQTVDGNRVYNADADTRKAMLHTVGDNERFISTAVQNANRSDLAGYNFFTGDVYKRQLQCGDNRHRNRIFFFRIKGSTGKSFRK